MKPKSCKDIGGVYEKREGASWEPGGESLGSGRRGGVQRATKTNRKLDIETEFKAITH